VYCSESFCSGKVSNPDGGTGIAGTCNGNYVGQPCSGHYSCNNHTFCGTQGTCETATMGGPCDDADNCPSSSYCGSAGLCRALVANGGSCEIDSNSGGPGSAACATSGYRCIASSAASADAGIGTCAIPGSTGASCPAGVDGFCKIPNECISGSCTLTGSKGQPCSSNGHCFDGACVGRDENTGARGTCGSALADNQPCSEDFACVSGFCDQQKGLCSSVCQ
jgi:hypothetical protein